jgi:hypothetical protein
LMVLYQEMELTSLNLLEQLIDVLYMNFYKKKTRNDLIHLFFGINLPMFI